MPQFEMPPLEEVIMSAVVQAFFTPQVSRIDFMPGQMMNGVQQMQPFAQYAEPPLLAVARIMYADHAKEIAEKVWEKIDVEDLADRLAVRVVKELLAPDRIDRWHNVVDESPGTKKVIDKVHEQVAAELTRRALVKLDQPEETPS